MPESRYTDRELLARASELLEASLREYSAARGRNLTAYLLRLQLSTATVAVSEVLIRGQYAYIVTSNNSTVFNVLARNRQLLRTFELLGDPNTNVYPKPTAEEVKAAKLEGRSASGRVTIHAEQLGAWSARALGGSLVRVATSWRVCPVCRSFFVDFFPRVRLIDSATRLPPPTPPRAPSQGPVPAQASRSQAVGARVPGGYRAAAGLVLIIQGATFVMNRIVEEREAARVNRAIQAKDSYIRNFQEQNPYLGILVHLYFRDGIFLPPLHFSYGSTRRDAIASYQSAPPSEEVSTVWVPPSIPPAFSYYRPPFARAGLATFAGRMVFQDVAFRFVGGFDDDGESIPLVPPRGFAAKFWLLKPPREVTVFFGGRWHSKEVDVTMRHLSSGQLKECIALDTSFLSIGDDSALMVFPADEVTAAWFARVPGTSDRAGVLRRYDLARVRWVAPEKVRLVEISP